MLNQTICILIYSVPILFRNIMKTYSRYQVTVDHGKGSKLYDTQGNEYLDFTAGIATCCLGHSHPGLKEAICKQMDKVHHVSNLYFIPEQANLAKWLVENSCADKVSKLLSHRKISYFLQTNKIYIS